VIVGLDTSVVVRLLVGEPAAQAHAARARVARHHGAGDTILVTDLAIAEAYHALQHHYRVPKDEARELLRRFLDSGVVAADPAGTPEALARLGGAGLVDRLIHARHRSCAATTLTFERRQAQLEGAERVG
jgi:predicted nucleic acid-binding protein